MDNNHDGYCTRFFSALANRLRVRMLQELSVGPKTVNELSARLGSERTLISHNLAILVKAELVDFRKDGKTRIYKANEQVVPYVFFMLDRIVCSQCSLKKTCAALRERQTPPFPRVERKSCPGCR